MEEKSCHLLERQIENSQIILSSLFLEEEFDELAAKGTTVKRVIIFLDKLENESHERNADQVLIPYKEYHALHELYSERPLQKAALQKKHAKLVHNLNRVLNLEVKKKT